MKAFMLVIEGRYKNYFGLLGSLMEESSLKKVGKLKVETVFLVKIQNIMIKFNHKSNLLSNHNLFEDVN